MVEARSTNDDTRRASRGSPQRGFALGALLGTVVAALAVSFLYRELNQKPPPPVLAEVGQWELKAHTDEAFGTKDLKGKIWVANFIFTRCLMSCPRITQTQKDLLADVERFKALLGVHFVSFTVDPEFDTPAVLQNYREKNAIASDRWTFMTGATDEVFGLLREKMFAHIGEKKIHGDPKEGLIDIAHLERLAIFDESGRLRATVEANDEGRAEALDVIWRLRREVGPS